MKTMEETTKETQWNNEKMKMKKLKQKMNQTTGTAAQEQTTQRKCLKGWKKKHKKTKEEKSWKTEEKLKDKKMEKEFFFPLANRVGKNWFITRHCLKYLT